MLGYSPLIACFMFKGLSGPIPSPSHEFEAEIPARGEGISFEAEITAHENFFLPYHGRTFLRYNHSYHGMRTVKVVFQILFHPSMDESMKLIK